MKTIPLMKTLCAALLVLAGCPAGAQSTYSVADNFTGASASQAWNVYGGACLTAGNGTGSIPACVGNSYYPNVAGDYALGGGYNGSMPDTPGQGALRLTNNHNNETGAIASNFTFNSGSGVNITFVTTTYGGNGADGMTFFLMDGSVTPTVTSTGQSLGGSGGSLGYSCSNVNSTFDGLQGAYIGIGIDEYGNFQNGGTSNDNTNTGPGFQPNSIAVRGKGNVSWGWLNANYPSYYPSSLSASNRVSAVQNTCRTGKLWNYSNASNPSQLSTSLPANSDYGFIPPTGGTTSTFYPVLPNTLWSGTNSRSQAAPITYQVTISSDNLLTLLYSYNGGNYQTILNGQSIVNSNGSMPATLRFGFAGSTGGLNNIHEVACFRAAPATQAFSSSGANTPVSGNLQTSTQEYIPSFHANNWWGGFASYGLNYNSTTNVLAFNSTATWDASCVLTGNQVAGGGTVAGTCSSTNAALTAPQSPSSRVILTSNWSSTSGASVGTPFEWANLTSAQQAALTAGDASQTANRLNYLRGVRSNEIVTSGSSSTGSYRARTGVLGDIQESAPSVVSYPTAPYTNVWTDNLGYTTLPENATGATSYSSFASTYATRQNVVYVGANDGLLHGFRTGAYNSSGSFVNSSNDGQEVLAYMPGTLLNTIHSTTAAQDYANTLYSHVYSEDGSPYTGDLFYKNAWHTWLVSGLGPGGAGIFALDVTNPSNFAEGNANSLVIGEWNSSTISCVNVTSCGGYLGNTYGTPQIRRFHNGQWGFIFGNGFGSANNTAGVYIGLVNTSTGAVSFYFLNTGNGSSSAPNGIAYVTPADLDGDHTVDYAYAGDLWGNIWRFDLTSNNPSNWIVSKYGQATASPLYTATGGTTTTTNTTTGTVSSTQSKNNASCTASTTSNVLTPVVTVNGNTTTTVNTTNTVVVSCSRVSNNNYTITTTTTPTLVTTVVVTSVQPITTKLAVALDASKSGAYRRVMVDFGTGQRSVPTASSAAVYAGGAQALYGIWDWDMANWNSLQPTSGGSPKDSLTGPKTITISNLQPQTVTSSTVVSNSTNGVSGVRTTSSNVVCWSGSTTCSGGTSANAQFGWYLNLPTSSEQVIYSPVLYQGAYLVVNTTIPANNSPLNCDPVLDSGWTMTLASATGAAPAASAYAAVSSTAAVSGLQLGAVGTPSFVNVSGSTFMVNNTSGGSGNIQQFTPPYPTQGQRINWRQIR